MAEQPPPAPSEDYAYDLAHEVTEAPAEPGPDRPPRPHTYVATTTDDAHGDYGYDLAHDVPPGGHGRP